MDNDLEYMPNEGGITPVIYDKKSPGIEFFSPIDLIIEPGEQVIINTHVVLKLPEGKVGILKDKSSVVTSKRLKVDAGLIDTGYRGEIKVVLRNIGKGPTTVERNDSIAQMILVPCSAPRLIFNPNISKDTVRGTRGFGELTKQCMMASCINYYPSLKGAVSPKVSTEGSIQLFSRRAVNILPKETVMIKIGWIFEFEPRTSAVIISKVDDLAVENYILMAGFKGDIQLTLRNKGTETIFIKSCKLVAEMVLGISPTPQLKRILFKNPNLDEETISAQDDELDDYMVQDP